MSEPWTDARARDALRAIFDAGVAAADPRMVLAPHLPPAPRGRCVVVGAGKAAATMAAAVEAAWPDVALTGVVVTRYGHAVPTRRIEVLESSHPVPDARSEAAARRILAAVRGLGPDDLVLALISGGASALLALPAPGLTLADKAAVNRALLACGATITEMNTVRKHLSAIKGGRLAAAAAPARVVTLAISDVPGDDPAVIGSGPTLPDRTTIAEARAILARTGFPTPDAVRAHLASEAAETPKSLADGDVRMIATPMLALHAAAAAATRRRTRPADAGRRDRVREPRARPCHRRHRAVRPRARHAGGPALHAAVGGRDDGQHRRRAGRARRPQHRVPARPRRRRWRARAEIWAIAGDTDGIDGTEDAAGRDRRPPTRSPAPVLPGSIRSALLAGHDSYTLFAALGDLVRTGPTLTNVNDLRAILIA